MPNAKRGNAASFARILVRQRQPIAPASILALSLWPVAERPLSRGMPMSMSSAPQWDISAARRSICNVAPWWPRRG